MNQPKKVTCPNCNGSGCPLCRNQGTLYLTQEQLKKVQAMLRKLPRTRTSPQSLQPKVIPVNSSAVSSSKNSNPGARFSGLITVLILTLLFGGSAVSYFIYKSFRPFIAGLITVGTSAGTKLLWNSKLVKPLPPEDFIGAIGKIDKSN